jgi:hypothetical protein
MNNWVKLDLGKTSKMILKVVDERVDKGVIDPDTELLCRTVALGIKETESLIEEIKSMKKNIDFLKYKFNKIEDIINGTSINE